MEGERAGMRGGMEKERGVVTGGVGRGTVETGKMEKGMETSRTTGTATMAGTTGDTVITAL
jgi:hypothetical protein